MKKILLLGGVFLATTIALVSSYALSHNTVVASLLMTNVESLARGEIPGSYRHSQVIGCGSYDMHDWQAGCCAGNGGCSYYCHENFYCD